MDITQKLKNIKAICSDVDGVLTDGKVIVLQNGALLRTMNVYDGLGIKKALDSGLIVAFFTGGSGLGVHERLKSLGVKHIYTRVEDKLPAVEDFLKKTHLNWNEILYVGDDIIDIPVLQKAGVKVAPPNAVNEVKAIVDFITKQKGGEGALREIIEIAMKIQNKWI